MTWDEAVKTDLTKEDEDERAADNREQKRLYTMLVISAIRVRKLFRRNTYACECSWGPLANMRVTPRSQVGERQAFGSFFARFSV